MQDVIDACNSFNWVLTEEIFNQHTRDHPTACYLLFQRILKPAWCSCMAPATTPGAGITKRNAFYEIRDERERELMSSSVEELERVSRYNPETDTVDLAVGGPQAMSDITRVLLRIETAKIGTFLRVARQALISNPTCKVVLCVNYRATLGDLVYGLSDYMPLVLDGSTPGKSRARVIELFAEPSRARRVLVANLTTCSTGLDLDDKDGGFPRLALVSPNYSSITLYQLSHRFLRMDSKSAATVHFVFGKHAHEARVLQALARKGEVMRMITPEQTASGVEFPGQFASWVEPAM
jgi:hypothetical protein